MDHPFDTLAEPAAKRRRLRFVALGVVVAVVAAGGAAVAGVGSAAGASYRSATVATRAVDEVLHAVAVVEPVTQASVAFPVDGTVANVNVAVGDAVSVGQTLASLDTTALEATLTQRQAELDQAELVLEQALAGESVAGTGNADAQTIALRAPSATGDSDAELAAAQQAVLDAQQQVDSDLLAAQQALASATQICGSDDESAADTRSTPSTPSTTSTTTGASSPDDELAACRAALDAVMTAQQQVAAGQTALAQASTALDALLAPRAAASGSSTESPVQSPTQDAPSTPSTPSSNGGSTSPSAEDLVAYQKAVDAAALQVAVAAQAVEQATIASPIAGTVAAVNLAAGDDVGAASATDNIVVVGAGDYEVTTTVSVADLPDVEVGQPVTIRPDGSDATIDGQVVSIGVAGTTSSGATTYPVVIGIVGEASGLRNGSIASVAIVTNATASALAVPTSAITTEGNRHTVRVLDGGKVTTKTVEIGAIGATWTEVASGVDAGEEVVLADLNEPLPGSATDGSRNTNQFGFPGGRVEFGQPPGN